MESIEDTHIPDEVLERCALRGFPVNRPEITNHLIACDSCNDVYEAALHSRREYAPATAPRTVRKPLLAPFRIPAPVWAAAAAAVLFLFLNPAGRHVSVPAQVLDIAAVRGGQTVQAKAGVPSVLRLDTTGLDVPASVEVVVVNDRGRAVWTGTATQDGKVWKAEIGEGFRPGRFWVRIPDPAEPWGLLREFQLDVQ